MMMIKTLVILAAIVFGYTSSTWFVFGAVHPCDILIARQKDHEMNIAERHHREELESLKQVARTAFPKERYEKFVENLEEYSGVSLREANQERSVVINLRQKTREMTPAQCAWKAVTWRPSKATSSPRRPL
jgi:hypothetical protein